MIAARPPRTPQSRNVWSRRRKLVALPADDLDQLAIDRGLAHDAESQLRSVIDLLEKDKNAGDEFNAYIVLAKSLFAQQRFSESRIALQRARSLIDTHSFTLFSIPLDTLEARAKAAAAPSGNAGRERLLTAQRDLNNIIQRARAIGYYTAECEGQVALAEIEARLSASDGTAHLSEIARQAQQRGFLLYAAQAQQMKSRSVALALDRVSN